MSLKTIQTTSTAFSKSYIYFLISTYFHSNIDKHTHLPKFPNVHLWHVTTNYVITMYLSWWKQQKYGYLWVQSTNFCFSNQHYWRWVTDVKIMIYRFIHWGNAYQSTARALDFLHYERRQYLRQIRKILIVPLNIGYYKTHSGSNHKSQCFGYNDELMFHSETTKWKSRWDPHLH